MTNASATPRIADATPQNWVERFVPAQLVPYAQLMRLDRPIGWWLLLLPCWWGLALGQIAAGGGLPNLWHGFLFFVGAVVMRGAGCTLNDIADRHFDARVERTKLRPIASGRVSLRSAFIFLGAQLLVGLVVLLCFNWPTVLTASASLAIVAVYPFMKRITHWPQAVLGLAFNWGALVGWTATHGKLALPAMLLYLGGIAWTLAYDTIYAHQDKEDDVLIGVKSTALLFGDRTGPWLSGFFALAIAFFASAIYAAGGGLLAVIGLAGAALHAVWQIIRFDHANSGLCLKLFKANRTFGLILLAGLLLETIF